MLIRDMMTPRPLTVTAQETLQGAMELMAMKRIRHLPVVDQHGVLIGLLSDRDLRRVAPSPMMNNQAQGQSLMAHTSVEKVMVRAPTTVFASQDVRDAVRVFVEKKYGALPVLENGKLVGILTPIDVMKAWPGSSR